MIEHIRQFYPNVSTWPEVTSKYLEILSSQYCVNVDKIVFATSICPDELNYRATNFDNHFKQAFYLGGLGGIPYTGKTGMAAYASHIADDGAAFIFYGSHVGIHADGTIGVVQRPHQHGPTYSCGALLSVLEKMKKDFVFDWSSNNFEDLQARVIEKVLHNHKERIFEAEHYVVEAVNIIYDISECMLRQFVLESKLDFPCKDVFLLGGVIINTDAGTENYVEIRNFEHIRI
jgi:hypothetical protein